ncbi:DUF4365 domain-containing protein [Methanolobus profundi]|uniref:DUF4365 domain-containing protein n=1 Tax=Methanolobus profundi TaxID=487685 RepID=A0A1I4PWT8_9EURY|nr:DUF4365 domain-containing protein [Methanolobus profundi]SFM31903.1 protein of unknown function [Methanolobus profundi]
MDETITCKPAKYPYNDTLENNAITVLEYILDQNFVKTDLNKRDKVPNIDGYFEIVDIDQIPIGKLEIQVKKLSDNNLENPKYQCKVEFLKYCEESVLPVFLILVDIQNNIAYWKLCNNLFKELSISKNAKTKTVKILPEKYIRKGESGYIQEWKEIIANYKIRISSYEPLKEELQQLKEDHDLLIHNSEPLLNSERDEFQKIHIFLDNLNFHFDTYLNNIKKILYPNCWKLGLAYSGYEKDSIAYILYPINMSSNDLQIREFSSKLTNQLDKSEFGYTTTIFYSENPIQTRPKEYATELAKKQAKEVLEKKALNIQNLLLAEELLFSFIDRNNEYLGLKIKNKYDIDELDYAFFVYFPIFIEETAKKVNHNLSLNPIINIDLLTSKIAENDLKLIIANVKTRLENKDRSIFDIYLKSTFFSSNMMNNLFDFIKNSRRKTINRVYVPPDFSRLQQVQNNIWHAYSLEDIQRNAEIIYKQSVEVYNFVIEKHFPLLKEEMSFFKNFNRIIFVIDNKENPEQRPIITTYYLQNKEVHEQRIDVFLKNQDQNPFKSLSDVQKKRDNLILDGQKYKLMTLSKGVSKYLFDPLPMHNYIYDLLSAKLDRVDFNSDQLLQI